MKFSAIASGLYLEGLGIGREEVWFSDAVRGGVHRLLPGGTLRTWLPERRWIGSLLLNQDGAVLCSGPGGIVWFQPSTGVAGALLDKIDGQAIGGVNEMVPDGRGGIYFATLDITSMAQKQPRRPSALYRLASGGRVTQLADDLQFPNGMGVSPDGRRLYHNDTRVGTYSFDIRQDGSLGERTLLFEKTDGDGLAIDTQGNIWVTGFLSGDILCLQPDGTVVKRVALPGEGATNVRFGGEDGRDLYVTTVPRDIVEAFRNGIPPSSPRSVLHLARSDVPGLTLAQTNFRLTRRARQ